MNMIKTGGYHIYATIDMDVQKLVDDVYQDLDRIPTTDSQQQLSPPLWSLTTPPGDIVAMAGGVGKKEISLSWNRATQSTLQPGSAIKPISVYGPAMEANAVDPSTVLFDGPLYDSYPQNYDRRYTGAVSVLTGVSASMNTIACRVVEKIGTDYSFDFAKNKFGLSDLISSQTINGSEKTDIALAPHGHGRAHLWRDRPGSHHSLRHLHQPWRLAGEPDLFRGLRLRRQRGPGQHPEHPADHQRENRGLYELYALVRSELWHGLSGPPVQHVCGGKTGTTSDDNDRWFAGYTPYYTAVVWCGYDQPESIYLTGNYENPSARLWHAVMEPLHEGLEDKDLFNWSNLTSVTICRESGKLGHGGLQSRPTGRLRPDRVCSIRGPTHPDL